MQNNSHSTANSTETPPPFAVSRVNVGDQCITLRTWPGAGPPLLLIHGIGSTGASWESAIPALAEVATPIALDLRGHGDSARPDHGYLYDDYIDDLDGVLDTLGIERPLLMGHSLGGIVALWWAARHPDGAAGVVVADSPLRSGYDFAPAFGGWLRQNAMPVQELAVWYAAEHPDWTPDRARSRAEVMTGTARNVFVELRADSLAHDGVDRLAEIAHVTSPILLVRGDPETGSMVVPADADAFEARLPNARVARIPGAGHALYRTHSSEFAGAVLPFLREVIGST
ncbi:MAG: alpha/beta hydrolase [Chloroflexota bacterium]|nr:alpha/beta hydrolase [Chloroflexota bacterium]